MTPLVSAFTLVSSIGVVLSNILTLFLLCVFLMSRVEKEKKKNLLLDFVSTHAFSLLILISLLSLGGSYFYSLVAGFTPCKLCWIQRSFFFALLALYLLGWYQAGTRVLVERSVFVCSFVITLFALIVSVFQYYGSMFNPGILSACEAQGVSCSKNYFLYFGYINIPMMALSAFLLVCMILIIRLYHKHV